MWSWQSGQLLASVFNYAGPGGYRRRERSEAIQQSLGPGYVRDITYSSLVVPAWSATRWLGSPAFTDVFVRRESLQGLRPPSVVASINEVGKVIFELIVSIVMIALDGRFFDCSVHALDLAIRPWMLDLGQPVFDAIFPAAHIEHMRHVSCRRAIRVARRESELDPINRLERCGSCRGQPRSELRGRPRRTSFPSS